MATARQSTQESQEQRGETGREADEGWNKRREYYILGIIEVFLESRNGSGLHNLLITRVPRPESIRSLENT